MSLRKDLWRCAVVEAPLAAIWARGSLAGLPLHWLPDEPGLRYLADPFGLWMGEKLFVFVEAYGHRDRHGTIEVLVLDRAFRTIARGPALAEPWHLSYPQVFTTADGAIWMLPEAAQSGRLTLYQAVEFPFRWERAAVIAIDASAVDATPLLHDGGWWLFYGAGPRVGGTAAELRCAFAEALTGPWTTHPAGPIATAPGCTRPGGTAIVVCGQVILPVQDCSRTYGGALRALTISKLLPDRIEATLGPAINPPANAARSLAGLHTLSAAGAVTLVDMKRRSSALRGLASDLGRASRRLRAPRA